MEGSRGEPSVDALFVKAFAPLREQVYMSFDVVFGH